MSNVIPSARWLKWSLGSSLVLSVGALGLWYGYYRWTGRPLDLAVTAPSLHARLRTANRHISKKYWLLSTYLDLRYPRISSHLFEPLGKGIFEPLGRWIGRRLSLSSMEQESRWLYNSSIELPDIKEDYVPT